MNTPRHPFWFDPAPKSAASPEARRQPRFDVLRGTQIFRAPSLPTAPQIYNELPFTVRFRPHSGGSA